MKKEKQVKAYQRKTASGKTVVVKAHTAKYDAAEDKAKKAALAKKGAGDEFAIRGIDVKDFKDWYLFDDWDYPQEEWPESVRQADSAIRRNLGGDKKAYDKFCAKIDDNWTPGGYVRMHSAYVVHKNKVAPPPIVIMSGDEGKPSKKTPAKKTPSKTEETPASKKKAPRKSKRKGCKTC